MEWFVGTRIGKLAKQRLAIGVASAQGIKADALMGKVNVAAHQSMEPMLIHGEGLAEQMHVAVIVASAQIDHRSLERGLEIELEPSGESAPVGGGFPPGGGFAAISRDVMRGDGREALDIGNVVAAARPCFAKGR